ncbi:MAG: hypothetical protein K8H90_07570 [Thermoanaerobaculia bacterium]|nr:hypothetical protein [Thermoanaerobaculia bacterium]
MLALVGLLGAIFDGAQLFDWLGGMPPVVPAFLVFSGASIVLWNLSSACRRELSEVRGQLLKEELSILERAAESRYAIRYGKLSARPLADALERAKEELGTLAAAARAGDRAAAFEFELLAPRYLDMMAANFGSAGSACSLERERVTAISDELNRARHARMAALAADQLRRTWL